MVMRAVYLSQCSPFPSANEPSTRTVVRISPESSSATFSTFPSRVVKVFLSLTRTMLSAAGGLAASSPLPFTVAASNRLNRFFDSTTLSSSFCKTTLPGKLAACTAPRTATLLPGHAPPSPKVFVSRGLRSAAKSTNTHERVPSSSLTMGEIWAGTSRPFASDTLSFHASRTFSGPTGTPPETGAFFRATPTGSVTLSRTESPAPKLGAASNVQARTTRLVLIQLLLGSR